MKLFLHAGMSKAGSSSIQATIHRNRDALKEQGILVPRTGAKGRRHFKFIHADGGDYKDLVDRLIAEAEESHCHTVILSDESFNKKNPTKHNYLKTCFDEIKIVFFLRRQDLLLESYYNQMIKGPWAKKRSYAGVDKLTDYGMSLHWLHYDRLLDNFAAIFGSDAVMAFPFEKGAIPNNLGRFFLVDVCGAARSGLKLKQTIANSAIPYSGLGILRALNKMDLSIISGGGEPRRIIQDVIRRELSDTSKYIIGHEARKTFMKNYEEGNSYVAEKYLNPSSKKLFKVGPPPADIAIQETHVPVDVTIAIMEKIIAALAKSLHGKAKR